jgi:uncharacterized protein (TIGR00369 family)
MTKKTYALESLFGSDRNELASHTPHCVRLGIRVLEAGPYTTTIKLPYSDELIGDPRTGVVFGGAIVTLLDQASGLSVHCSLETFRMIATLDLRVDYMRKAEPGLDLIGRADCYKMTNNVAFVRGVAYEKDPEDPFATSLATFMLGAELEDSHLKRKADEEAGQS